MQFELDTSYDKCIKCNACVVNCPVSKNTLEFGGPKHLGPEIKRLTENQESIDDPRFKMCTLCGTCNLNCPEEVNVTKLIANAKAADAKKNGSKYRDILLGNAEFIGKVASPLAPVVNTAMRFKPMRLAMQGVLKIDADQKFPKYTFNSFRNHYKIKLAKTKRKVAYFTGCYTNYNAPEVGEAFIEVMKKNGIEVAIPKQKCCGIPLVANGRMEHAEKNAKYNTESFLEYIRKGYDVVVTCSSCSSALKKDYNSLYNIEGTDELSKHVYDASEYLRMLIDNGDINPVLAENKVKVGYFAPCHMKAQGIGNPAMDVLQLIPNYEITDLAADCCGQCGTFGFKKEYHELSLNMGRSMEEAVKESEYEYIVTECGMCKNQIDNLTDSKVMHPMQVLADVSR